MSDWLRVGALLAYAVLMAHAMTGRTFDGRDFLALLLLPAMVWLATTREDA